jgi:hypothetical protein
VEVAVAVAVAVAVEVLEVVVQDDEAFAAASERRPRLRERGQLECHEQAR